MAGADQVVEPLAEHHVHDPALLDRAAAFERIADLLAIQQANPFRIRAYRNAARQMEAMGTPATDLVARGEDLTELPGWGLYFGILLLVGGFMSLIIGMLYKIVPFLAWMHLRNRGSATLTVSALTSDDPQFRVSPANAVIEPVALSDVVEYLARAATLPAEKDLAIHDENRSVSLTEMMK